MISFLLQQSLFGQLAKTAPSDLTARERRGVSLHRSALHTTPPKKTQKEPPLRAVPHFFPTSEFRGRNPQLRLPVRLNFSRYTFLLFHFLLSASAPRLRQRPSGPGSVYLCAAHSVCNSHIACADVCPSGGGAEPAAPPHRHHGLFFAETITSHFSLAGSSKLGKQTLGRRYGSPRCSLVYFHYFFSYFFYLFFFFF